MDLKDRKDFILNKAKTKLSEEDLIDFTKQVENVSTQDELKTLVQEMKPLNWLTEMKEQIDMYIWFLKNRGVQWKELEKRKKKMLNATTHKEFIQVYKWEI